MRNPVTILCALALTAFVVSLPLVLDAQEAEEPAPTPQIWPEYQDEVSKSEALRSLRGNFEVEWVETSGDKGNETKVTYKGSASRLPMLGRDALEEKLMLASEDGSVLRVHHMIYGFSEASGNFIVTWLADRQAAPWILEGKTKKRDTVFSLKYSAGGGAKKISVEREIEVDSKSETHTMEMAIGKEKRSIVATYKRLKAIALQDRLKPTQAHAILHQYIGNWDAKMTFYQDGKESDVKMEGELEVGHLYNGLYTLFNMKYTKPAPMESMAILGIDPSTGQIRSAAIASLNSGNEHATFLRVGNNIVGFRAGYNELNGEWRYIRQVSTPVVAGEYTESLEELMKDGTWRKIGVTTFTKKQAGSEGG